MGWLEDIGSAADRFLGGTGGQPMTPAQTAQSQFDEFGGQVPEGAHYEPIDSHTVVPTDSGSSYDVMPETPSGSSEQGTAAINEYAHVGENMDKTERHEEESGVIKDTGISGPERFTSIISQTPEKPTADISKYYQEPEPGTLTSAAYIATKDLGDRKTQEMIATGLTPEQALAEQYRGASLAGDTRAANYYENEWRKANVSNIALSGEYHAAARESGLPTKVNPFENVADISQRALARMEGTKLDTSSGVPSLVDRGSRFDEKTGVMSIISGREGTFKDMLGITPSERADIMLESANIGAKAERSGDLGVYGMLGGPTFERGGGAGGGVLSIEDQQRIGAAAATSKYNAEGQGWEIKPEKMDKFTDKLLGKLGYGGGEYVEAELPKAGTVEWTSDIRLIGGGAGGKSTTSQILGLTGEGKAEVRAATKPLSQIAENAENIVAGDRGTGRMGSAVMGENPNAPDAEITESKKSIGSNTPSWTDALFKGTTGTGRMGSAVLGENPNIGEFRPLGVVRESGRESSQSQSKKIENKPTRSAIDVAMGTSGESTVGYTLEDVGVLPGNWRTGSAMAEIGAYRKSKKSNPSINRKISQSRSFNLDAVNGIMSKSIGAGKITFKTPSINAAVASVGSPKVKSKMNTDSKAVLGNFDIPSVKGAAMKKKKRDVASNIESIVGKITQSTKIKKVKAR